MVMQARGGEVPERRHWQEIGQTVTPTPDAQNWLFWDDQGPSA